MKTRISVTQFHIRRGTILADRCPIALAIRLVVKRGLSVCVTPRISYDSTSGGTVMMGHLVLNLPYRANFFANRFDNAVTARSGRAHLKPFTFMLDIPREMVRVRA